MLGVCRRMIQQEPSFLNVLCLAKDSPLARLCAEYEFVRCGEAPLDLRDGFVATNSLLALAIIVSRSYSQLTHQGADIPQNLEELLQASSGIDRWVEALRETCLTTVKRPYLLVLHGGGPSMSAAFDLESKCSEAALAAVQVSDYRNFAHGRHHWLAKKGAEDRRPRAYNRRGQPSGGAHARPLAGRGSGSADSHLQKGSTLLLRRSLRSSMSRGSSEMRNRSTLGNPVFRNLADESITSTPGANRQLVRF